MCIPIFRSIVISISLEAINGTIDYEMINEELVCTGDLFALQVRDSSMESVLYEKDAVIIRPLCIYSRFLSPAMIRQSKRYNKNLAA